MDFFKRFELLLLNFSFVMIYIIHKMLKNHLNHVKVFHVLFRDYNRFVLFFKI